MSLQPFTQETIRRLVDQYLSGEDDYASMVQLMRPSQILYNIMMHRMQTIKQECAVEEDYPEF